MDDLKVKGKIEIIGEMQTFESGFNKVEFVIDTGGDYPQKIKFECIKDKAEQFIKYNKIGDDVEVSFNIRGNEWKEKYYVTLLAWKVFKEDATSATSATSATILTAPAPIEDENDGLPF